MSDHPSGWRAGLLASAAVALIVGVCFLIPPSPFRDDPEPDPPPTLPESVWVEHLPVDGQLVTCVFRSSHGISCDWLNPRPLDAGVTAQTVPQAPRIS